MAIGIKIVDSNGYNGTFSVPFIEYSPPIYIWASNLLYGEGSPGDPFDNPIVQCNITYTPTTQILRFRIFDYRIGLNPIINIAKYLGFNGSLNTENPDVYISGYETPYEPDEEELIFPPQATNPTPITNKKNISVNTNYLRWEIE